MFSDIFPDPALLFRFKIAVHRLPDIENLADFDHWGFETRHQMPPIDRLGGQHTPILAKIGWNPQGIFLEIGVDLLARKKQIVGIYGMQLILKVNSRYNPSLLRENEFCSSFQFLIDDRLKSNMFPDGPLGAQRLIAEKLGVAKRLDTQEDPTGSLLIGWFRPTDTGLNLWLHIGSEMMQGYRPEEFPDIGLNFASGRVSSYAYGDVIEPNMVYAQKTGAGANPSLWTQCRLV